MKTDEALIRAHRLTIAILNDDSFFQHLLGEVLANEGYQIIQCGIDAQGYATLREAKPDLALLNVQLGAPDPWTTVELLRLDSATRHIPLVVCSMNIRLLHDMLPRLQELNCVIIEAPFILDNLLATLHALTAAPPQERACEA
jgi:CheY-like chemotaxis protein